MYFGDNTLSTWIGPNNDSQIDGNPGLYDYQTTFSLLGFQASTASISGLWSSDNDGVKILLNGVDISAPGTLFDQFLPEHGFAPFSITSGFLPSVNTLDFIVHNGGTGIGNNDPGANPTALRVQMTGTATVPDAGSTIAMLGMGLMGVGMLRRKLQKV